MPVIKIGDSRELFVDRRFIERMDGTALKLHEPISGGVAIRIDKTWEGPANFGAVVIRYEGRYLMYYRGMTLNTGDNGVLCVAISDDGMTWTKPKLGRIERAGFQDTNIVTDGAGQPFGGSVWFDSHPGVPENERIKAITSEPVCGEIHTPFRDPKGPKRLVFSASADGFVFRKLDLQPEFISNLLNCFDGGNTMFWSESEQQYVVYYRWYEGAYWTGYRSMARATSKDLLHWIVDIPMTYGETPREQFYVNNTEPYFRAPHLYVALAARFMHGRRAVTHEQEQAIGLMVEGYANDCSDAVLLTSRAGSTQYDRTFMEAFVRPGLGTSNWVTRTNYPLTGIFPCGSDQVMFWVNRHYMQNSWHIERLLLRTDGFGSVTAPWSGGEMITQPFTFSGTGLEINYRTSAAGFVRVEIQDADGKPIPGYSADDSTEIIGDEISRIVTWKQGDDVSRLSGQQIRLRFIMKDADLFVLQFKTGASAPS